MNIEDMKKIASAALTVADDLSIETDRLRVFCHRVVDSSESAPEDFKVVTLDSSKAIASYLALKAGIIALAESIPTKVPEPEGE